MVTLEWRHDGFMCYPNTMATDQVEIHYKHAIKSFRYDSLFPFKRETQLPV